MGGAKKVKKVVFFTDLAKLPNVYERIGLSFFSNKEVLVKLHMGEVKNKFFPRPDYVRRHIDILHEINANPFLYDTTVVYKSPRKYKTGYEKVARLHGFTKKKVGCDVVIDDKGIFVEIEKNSYEVGKTLYNAKNILSLAHVKGHVATGMGGAIKNFGMGGVTSKTKQWIHHGSKPIHIQNNCSFCGVCADMCPFDAIKVTGSDWKCSQRSCFGCGVCIENCPFEALNHQRYDLQYTLACAAKACVSGKKVLYVNELKRIAKSCDCDPFAGPIICPDIGYVASDDIVAVDKASLDLINESKPDLFKNIHHVDPEKQLRFGEKIGLGSQKYKLISL